MSDEAFELGAGDSQIEKIRHSAAHIMAQAVKRLYPEAQFGVGPTIDGGFYYDMLLDTTLDDKILKKIEREMKRIVSSNVCSIFSFSFILKRFVFIYLRKF